MGGLVGFALFTLRRLYGPREEEGRGEGGMFFLLFLIPRLSWLPWLDLSFCLVSGVRKHSFGGLGVTWCSYTFILAMCCRS